MRDCPLCGQFHPNTECDNLPTALRAEIEELSRQVAVLLKALAPFADESQYPSLVDFKNAKRIYQQIKH